MMAVLRPASWSTCTIPTQGEPAGPGRLRELIADVIMCQRPPLRQGTGRSEMAGGGPLGLQRSAFIRARPASFPRRPVPVPETQALGWVSMPTSTF